MASIFNYSEDPPRVSSPWSTPRTSTPKLISKTGSPLGAQPLGLGLDPGDESPCDVVVTSLEAEPQEGPTEYKLHLLLRPRRHFTYSSTGHQVSGSYRSAINIGANAASRTSPPPQQQLHLAVSSVSRLNRLTQLTTQLLWRLEQSASEVEVSHNSSPAQLTISQISESGTLPPRTTPLPSVENSMGALYEIGIADDGTFVGLAEDELSESLDTLRMMAASLGCTVTVLRKVVVGDCEWLEQLNAESTPKNVRDSLWVAEAYVRPIRGAYTNSRMDPKLDQQKGPIPDHGYYLPTSQLRVTITGATMAGKSSLLGTLTTSTLDNGRGKSRMSLLRHQHEIASGMTSSVTHEILGYSNDSTGSNDVEIVNLASEHVNTWNDIHSYAQGGRVVLFSDSAGHPRYRRTAVRGLLGWSPHWTLLCIPADNLDDTTGQPGSTPPPHETLGVSDTDIDLSQEHLELCLKLDLPLVVLITKKDLATRDGLKRYLNKVLSVIKRAGRQPLLIPDGKRLEAELTSLSFKDVEDVRHHIKGLIVNPTKFVPILFTSALQGSGIRTLHALLHELPIPQSLTSDQPEKESTVGSLFDIEDVFKRTNTVNHEGPTLILSGIVRHGQIHQNDELVLGPFLIGTDESIHQGRLLAVSPSLPNVPSRPFHGSSPDLQRFSTAAQLQADQEWYKVHVTSIRNLRLATQTLLADQVGTIGISFADTKSHEVALNSVRKGMVLTSSSLLARRVFVADFARRDVDPLSIGSSVVVYFNSVRASAKIIAGAISESRLMESQSSGIGGDDDFTFQFGEDYEDNGRLDETDIEERLLVTFQFIASREYVEVGSKVLVMPGGGFGVYGGFSRGEKGVAGLSGFVGTVVEN
jgi:GTPase